MYDEEAYTTDLSGTGLTTPTSGTVFKTITSTSDDLYILIPEHDEETGLLSDDPRATFKAGPVKGWDRHSDGTFPQSGDPALVWLATDGVYWMSGWGEPSAIGAPPTGTSDLNYVFDQATPLSTWVIAHGLGKYCAVSVVDSTGRTVEGDIQYDSVNQVTLTFGGAFSGKAYLN